MMRNSLRRLQTLASSEKNKAHGDIPLYSNQFIKKSIAELSLQKKFRKPSESTYLNLLKVCSSEGDFRSAMKITEDMKKWGIPIGDQANELLIIAGINYKNLKDASLLKFSKSFREKYKSATQSNVGIIICSKLIDSGTSDCCLEASQLIDTMRNCQVNIPEISRLEIKVLVLFFLSYY